MSVKNLDKIFSPHRLAVMGSAEQAGRTDEVILHNLMESDFRGVIYPIVPDRESVLGVPAYGRVSALPNTADLAVICRPAEQVADAVRDCGAAGVPGVLILSPGFRDNDPGGAARLTELREVVREWPDLRVIGPNSLGVINTALGMNASLSPSMPRTGRLTFLSQSRSLSSAIVDRAVDRGVRLAHFVSVGHMMNVSFGDLIDYFSSERHTKSLILYLHSVKEPRSFMSAARAFARLKPIVAYKAGRHHVSARATASHTGQLVAEDMVYEAAFQRAGIVRAMELDDIFDVAELLASQRLPKGPRLAIVSNSGAAAVVAVDYLLAHDGVPAELGAETLEQLAADYPCSQPTGNPVNISEDASAECFVKVTQAVVNDRNVDAVVVLLTPQLLTQPTQTAKRLALFAKSTTKPILAAWIGGHRIRRGISILNQAGLPTHGTPEHAVRTFMHLVGYASNLEMIYETPREVPIQQKVDRNAVRRELRALVDAGQAVLDPTQAERLLTAYGIPVCRSTTAHHRDEAVHIAERLNCDAVVLKALTSPPMVHKADIGGVALELSTADEVAAAYDKIEAAVRATDADFEPCGVTVQPMVHHDQAFEMILGAKTDPTFGPVVMIGMGGVTTNILQDRSVGLPPLNERLARHMLESLRAWPLLQGYRGRQGVDVDALLEVLIRFSYLVANHPSIAEIDINPFIASQNTMLALDATVLLAGSTARFSLDRPYQHLAIRPYPEEYVQHVELRDGTRVCLRPIRPEDEPRWHELLSQCSDESIRHRFRTMFQRMSHDMASRYCFIDYDREITLVGELEQGGRKQLIAAGGLAAMTDRQSAEFSVLVVDAWQGKGQGGILLDHCLGIARAWGMTEVFAETDPDNHRMLAAFERRGFVRRPTEPDDDAVTVFKRLDDPEQPPAPGADMSFT